MELQRLAGNRAVARLVQVQRDTAGPVTMPPMTVTGDRGRPIEQEAGHLDQLRGQGVNESGISMSRDADSVNRNAPNPTDPLPFRSGGWDGETILNRLGQYDRIAGTDSDAVRCVQAVGLASHVVDGPEAVVQYLNAMEFQGLLASGQGMARVRAAREVLELIKGRLRSRTATYGDLSWAQEALHDMFYDDVHGTAGTAQAIDEQVSPTLDALSRTTDAASVWCNTPADVLSQARSLPVGGQLILTAWNIVFNATFDTLEADNVHTEGQTRMRVNINGHERTIRRIDASHRPNPRQIDEFSDAQNGHQLLIIKEGSDASPTYKLYEPEVTNSGTHLIALSAGGDELRTYLTDDADHGIFGYLQVMGRVTPSQVASAFGKT